MFHIPDHREAERQKALKREASLAKTGEPLTYRFGDDVVVLTKQPMEWGHTYQDGTKGSPAFKSKYKVEHNGVHRGWIAALNGWGAGWVVCKLDEDQSYFTAYRGVVESFTPQAKGVSGRDKLAEKIPGLVKSGHLGTIEEQGRRKREQQADRVRREQEAAEARVRHLAEWRAKCTAEIAMLNDRIEALEALIASQTLTNFQTEIMSKIISEAKDRLDCGEFKRALDR